MPKRRVRDTLWVVYPFSFFFFSEGVQTNLFQFFWHFSFSLFMKKRGLYLCIECLNTFNLPLRLCGTMAEKKKKLKSTRNEIPCRMSDTFGGTGGRESRKNKAEKETARSTVFLISPPSLYYFFLFFYFSFFGL